MARTDYGAILSTVIKDTSDAVREVNGTSSLIAPNQWGTAIRTMHSDSDYDNVMAQLIEETATGDIASFSDGANNIPCPSVLCTINPVQDLHGQNYPYPSGGGINKWDEEWETGGYDSSGNKQANPNIIRSKNKIVIGANTQFYFKCGNSNPTARFVFWDSNDNLISATAGYDCNAVNTSPNNAYYMAFNIGANYGNTYKNDISINIPSSDTSYHPYSNICPITGHTELNLVHTGANLWDEEWEVGAINTANGQNVSSSTTIRSKNYIPCIPSTPYYRNNPQNIIPFFYDNNKDFISFGGWGKNNVITTPNNAYYIRFYVDPAYGTTYNNDISINYPSTDTSYHAYTGTTTTTDLGTTVYGGTLDVVSGVLTLDRGYIEFDGTENWVNVGGSYPFAFQIDTGISNKVDNPIASQGIICNLFPQATTDVPSSNAIRWQVGGSTGRLYVYDYTHSGDLTGFTQMLSDNGLQVAYKLATPTTTQLTPQEVKSLLGSNSFYHDCNGQVAVTYRANGQLYVEQH